MLNSRLILPIVTVLAVVLLGTTASADPKWLITPEEAARVQAPTGDGKELVSAVKGSGPLIIVKSPKAFGRTRSPLNIFIAFEPGNSGQPPAMETLKVTLLGFFDINITDRLRDYISGTDLSVRDAELPMGTHRLRVLIKDISGNPNERTVAIKVIKK
jgi:hypothetical protein